MKHTAYVYQHKPTGNYVHLHHDDIGCCLYSTLKNLHTNCLYYDPSLLEMFLKGSIDSHGEPYALENFLEFEMRKVEVNLKLV